MVPEGSAALAAMAAAASAVSLALFGVDYYSLLYALIGALMALARSDQMSRGRAVLYVLLSTFAGAVIGNVVASYWEHPTRIALIALCLVGGLIAQVVATVILRVAPGLTEKAVRRIERAFGGSAGGGNP